MLEPTEPSLPARGNLAPITIAGKEQSVDLADYRHAVFMAFDRPPATAQGNCLTGHLAELIEGWERKYRRRKYGRGDRKALEFRRAIGLVTGDLLSVADSDPRRWIFRQMASGSFTKEAVSYRTFSLIFDALVGLGLIEVKPGFYSRREGWAHGKCTRLRASAVLLQLAADFGVQRGEAKRHFLRGLPGRPLVLKASSGRRYGQKVSGKRMRFNHNERTRRLEAEVRELNSFIEEHELQRGTHRGYRRIFNCGDDPAFDWNKGGRLYSQGEDSYQRLPKEERLRMLIDGQAVAEIDIRASFLTILYAARGMPLDLSRDPYEMPGLPRSVVKAWITMTLGHHAFHTRWPKEIAQDFLEEHGKKLGKTYPVRKVQEVVLAAHPLLADWPEQRLTCFDLMYIESEAIIRTMLQLKRERDLVCLSVHDSIIVPRPQAQEAAQILKEEYRRGVGVEPMVKISVGPGAIERIGAGRGRRRQPVGSFVGRQKKGGRPHDGGSGGSKMVVQSTSVARLRGRGNSAS